MSFIQIVDYRSARFDDIQKINAEWWNSEASVATARRVMVCRDRNDPDHYYTLAFFDSNESAMERSNNPATHQFSQRVGALVDEPGTFRDLDSVWDQSH